MRNVRPERSVIEIAANIGSYIVGEQFLMKRRLGCTGDDEGKGGQTVRPWWLPNKALLRPTKRKK
jgi:hypothetical protein